MADENPFYYFSPTKPEDFVGRWALVDAIFNDLISSRPVSCAVIGGKRFGKTSILKATEYRLNERLLHIKSGERYILPCIIDLQRCQPESEESLFVGILRYLYRNLKDMEGMSLTLSNTKLHSFLANRLSKVPFWEFEEILEDLCRAFESQVGLFRLILLLDEGESITAHSCAEIFFRNLRALIHDEPFNDMVQIVLTGSIRVIQIKERGSPLLNTVKLYYLENLSFDAIQEMTLRAGNVPNNLAQKIYDLSGGHPYIAQYLLHFLFPLLSENLPLSKVDYFATQLRQNQNNDLRGWWDAIGDSGQQAYALLSQNDNWPECDWIDESSLIRDISNTDQPITQGLNALCYHGLAIRNDSRKHYRAINWSFHDWLTHTIHATLTKKDVNSHSLAIHLHLLLHKYFNPEELRTLCFEIDIPYDDLGGEGHVAKARETILYLRRQGRDLSSLADYIIQKRPNLDRFKISG